MFASTEESHAVVKIDGEVLTLEKVGGTSSAVVEKLAKVGDGYFEIWSAGAIVLRLDIVVDGFTTTEEYGREPTLKAKATLSRGASTRVYKNLTYACGC